MDVFEQMDQTQVLLQLNDDDQKEETPDDHKPVGTLQFLEQKGLKEILFPIRKGENILGRAIELCQIHIPIKVLSKRHAVFEVEDETHCIYDAGSHNKSYRGKLCLKPHVRYELSDGDHLKFGDVLCRYYKTYRPTVNVANHISSQEDTELFIAGPSTTLRHSAFIGSPTGSSKKVELGSDIINVNASNTFHDIAESFQLKSDSEVASSDEDFDENTIPSSQPDCLVPETPFNPSKINVIRGSSPVVQSSIVLSESDSDTDIDEKPENTTVEKPLKTSTSALHSKAKKSAAESDTDWENMQTQVFNINQDEHSDDDLFSAETQLIPQPQECVKTNEAPTAPVANDVNVQSTVDDNFVTLSSDSEIRSAQENVARVLNSTVLDSIESSTKIVDDSVKASLVSQDESEITVSGILPIAGTSVEPEQVNIQDEVQVSPEESIKRKRRKESKTSKMIDNKSPVISQEASTSKRKMKKVINFKSPISSEELLSSKRRTKHGLPDPVALNPSLSTSPKTYTRRERDKLKDKGASPDLPDRIESVTSEGASEIDSDIEEDENAEDIETFKSDETLPDIDSPVIIKNKEKSKLSKKKTEVVSEVEGIFEDNVISQRRPTAPTLRIALGDSPTCQLLNPPMTPSSKVKPPKAQSKKMVVLVTSTESDNTDVNVSNTRKVGLRSCSKRKANSTINEVDLIDVVRCEMPSTPLPRTSRRTRNSLSTPTASSQTEKNSTKESDLKLETPTKKRRGRPSKKDQEEQDRSVSTSASKSQRTARTRESKHLPTDDASESSDTFEFVDETPVVPPSLRSSRKSRNSGVTETSSPSSTVSKNKPVKNQDTVVGESSDDESLIVDVAVTSHFGDNKVSPKRKSLKSPKRKSLESVTLETDLEPKRKKRASRNSMTAAEESSGSTTHMPPLKKVSPKTKKDFPVKNNEVHDEPEECSEERPKVMFTGMSDTKLEKMITDLGGDLVDSVFDCTHLITDKIRRTCKFLCVLARGLPIVGIDWIKQSKKAKHFLDHSMFIVQDQSAERQYGFELVDSLSKAKENGLLKGFNIHVTQSVRPEPDQMRPIIECAGGKFLNAMPRRQTSDDKTILIISCKEDLASCSPAVRAKIPIVGPEFILTGILKQEVDINSNLIGSQEESTDSASNGNSNVNVTDNDKTTKRKTRRR